MHRARAYADHKSRVRWPWLVLLPGCLILASCSAPERSKGQIKGTRRTDPYGQNIDKSLDIARKASSRADDETLRKAPITMPGGPRGGSNSKRSPQGWVETSVSSGTPFARILYFGSERNSGILRQSNVPA